MARERASLLAGFREKGPHGPANGQGQCLERPAARRNDGRVGPAMGLKAFMGMRMFRRRNILRAVRSSIPGRHRELDPEIVTILPQILLKSFR
jgi:hypothetical protein